MTTIRMYGTIGGEVTPAGVSKELDDANGPINVHINSFGGDAYAGITIANQLAAYNGDVTAIVEGIAASAASVILTGADEVLMYPASEIMVHEATIDAGGNSEAFAALSTQLDQLSSNMANLYASYTGGDSAEWRKAMKTETWFTAAEAIKAGLASRVIPGNTAQKPKAALTTSKTHPAAALFKKGSTMSTETPDKTEPLPGLTLNDEQTKELEKLLDIENIDAETLVDAVKALVDGQGEDAEPPATKSGLTGEQLEDARAEAKAQYLVHSWLKEGRFSTAIREQVINLAKIDPKLAMEAYGSRPANTIPVKEIGYTHIPTDELEKTGKRWVR